MKIRKFYFNNRRYTKKWIYILLVFFIIGICAGSVYAALLNVEFDLEINSYFYDYFNNIKLSDNRTLVLKNSLVSNIKTVVLIFLVAFLKPGILVILATVGLKGFICGFTAATFVKHYSVYGMLLTSSSIVSDFIYFPFFIYYCSKAVSFCINRQKTEKSKIKEFLMLSICCLTIFCITSFVDAFITTTFMKLTASKFNIK